MSEGTNSVRVMGVIGSPRRNGNTDLLVSRVLEGAAAEKAEIEKVYLSKLNIAPCRACEACKKHGRCAVKDDMQGVLDLMESSDIWILGTPVYFWGPTGWFKAFLDRWYGARYHIRLKDKCVILVVPFEDKNIATAEHTVGIIRTTLDYFGIKLLDSIIVPGVLSRGDVNEHPDFLDHAFRAGREAITNCHLSVDSKCV